MLVNFDCCATWFSDLNIVEAAMDVQRIYLQHQHTNNLCSPDLRHLQIPLGRRFRALKAWLTLSVYGGAGIRDYIRKRYKLAEYFEALLNKDQRFEVVHKADMGLLTFRLRGRSCEDTKKFLEEVTQARMLFMVPVTRHGKFLIRFVIGGFDPRPEDMDRSFEILVQHVNQFKS